MGDAHGRAVLVEAPARPAASLAALGEVLRAGEFAWSVRLLAAAGAPALDARALGRALEDLAGDPAPCTLVAALGTVVRDGGAWQLLVADPGLEPARGWPVAALAEALRCAQED